MMRGRSYAVHGLATQPDTWFVMPDSPTAAPSHVTQGKIADDAEVAGDAVVSNVASVPPLAPLQSIRLGQLHRVRVAPGTCSLWKVLKETGTNLLTSTQQIAGALVGGMAANAMTGRVAGASNPTDAYANNGVSHALATSMSVAATGFLTSTVATLKSARLSDKDAVRETYNALVAHSDEAIRQHPLPIQTAIHNLDRSVREGFSQNSRSVAWHEQKLRHREEVLMSIPYYAKDIAQWNVGNGQRKLIQEKVQQLIGAYPLEMRASLGNLIQRMRANSISDKPARVQAYLYGPPGTGKTRFVKELAKALDLPVIEIRLPVKQLETLYGYQYSVDYASANTSDLEIMGELPQKLIKSGYTNPIVFFDELTISNAQVLNGLKLLLDKAKETIRMEAFGVELDWRRATVFCASNDKLGHAALIKRMPQLDFLTVGENAKKQILFAMIDATMQTYTQALSAESMTDLKRICVDQYDFILRNDTSPGSRDLENVVENMVHLVASRLIDEMETSEANIRQHIANDFRTMRVTDQQSSALPVTKAAAEVVEKDSDEED